MSEVRGSAKRLALIFLGLTGVLFALGVIVFNWYVSSAAFNRRLESLRGRLRERGIQLGHVSVGRLGEIDITDFSVDLGGLGVLRVGKLTGRIQLGGFLSGKLRTTLDVTELVGQFLQLRFPGRLKLAPEGRVSFTFEGDPRSMEGGGGLQGEMALTDVVVTDVVTGHRLGLPSATLPVRSPGPVISLKGASATFAGLRFTLSGSVRNLLNNPEFVETVLSTVAPIAEGSKQVIDAFGDKEVSRKVGMRGTAQAEVLVDGPALSPRVGVRFVIPDYVLQFRGEFREILTTYEGVRGELSWNGDLDHPRIEGTVSCGPLQFDYSELAAQHLPHLYFRGQQGFVRLNYGGAVLTMEQLNLRGYGGTLAARVRVDLNRQPIQFDWKAVMQGFRFKDFLGDVSTLHGFMDGAVDAFFEGQSETLMLERMVGAGNVRIQGLSLVGLPDAERLLLPAAKRLLPGVALGSDKFEFKLDHASFDAMKIRFQGPGGLLEGFLHYNILTLELRSALGLTVPPATLRQTPDLARELPDGRLDLTLGGRVVQPRISYTPAAVAP